MIIAKCQQTLKIRFQLFIQFFYPNGILTHSPTHNFFIINFFTFTTPHKHVWASLVLHRHHRFLSISCNARPVPLVCYFLLDVTDDKATDTHAMTHFADMQRDYSHPNENRIHFSFISSHRCNSVQTLHLIFATSVIYISSLVWQPSMTRQHECVSMNAS